MARAVIVQAFIPNWPGPKQHPKEIASVITPYCPVTILDNPTHYFNAQWREARKQFTGDILLWVMADVQPPKLFGDMYNKAVRLMSSGPVGWYAPDIAWTCYIYDKKDLVQYESDIFEVPNTDSLCFFIRGDVVRAMPEIDPAITFMWGMDFTAIATARRLGLKVVRDYQFKASHPNSTGYNIDKASLEMANLMRGYPPETRAEMDALISECNRLKRLP